MMAEKPLDAPLAGHPNNKAGAPCARFFNEDNWRVEMATQTKADRQAAAQKAAATRKRNEIRETSTAAGRRAAATRQQKDAIKAAKRARKDVAQGLSGVGSAARSAREAAVLAGKSVATRVGVGPSD
jgi:hypothetical protein